MHAIWTNQARFRADEAEFGFRTVRAGVRSELSQAARVRLSIYDVRGRFVVKLFDDVGAAGMNGPLYWDGTDASGRQVPSGLYNYRLESESETNSRKMLLLK